MTPSGTDGSQMCHTSATLTNKSTLLHGNKTARARQTACRQLKQRLRCAVQQPRLRYNYQPNRAKKFSAAYTMFCQSVCTNKYLHVYVLWSSMHTKAVIFYHGFFLFLFFKHHPRWSPHETQTLLHVRKRARFENGCPKFVGPSLPR